MVEMDIICRLSIPVGFLLAGFIASQIMHVTSHGLLGHITKRQGRQHQIV